MPTLNVIVERVLYPKATTELNGSATWMILLTNHGKCTGKMMWRPQQKEQLVISGEWAAFQGERQFNFSSARLDIPVNPRDQLHYVVSRTPGLGPAAEELIWSRRGSDWLNLEAGEVPRLHGKLYAEFKLQLETLLQKSEEAKTVATLMGKGATQNMAQKAWAKWEDETLGVVNADPFRLAELEGYGFTDVDREICGRYGIEDGDKRRIRAAVIYSLRKLTDRGDTVVEWDALYSQACGMLCGFSDLVSECTGELFQEGAIRAFRDGAAGVALAWDYDCESAIWEWAEGVGVEVENARLDRSETAGKEHGHE